jgi:predicted ATPase/DNA-binding winged helix-turn-helix (wHTH) protein
MSRTRVGDRPAVRLEPENERAWCGQRRLELTPKAFAVLRHLVEHAERLVTKQDLLAAVWGETVVSEAALTSCIRDLRRALADSSQAPRYIETAHRRGFRFIGPLAPPKAAALAAPPDVPRPATLVGRDAELERLRALFAAAASGRRKLVFVTGEAGIGKTTLVEAFLSQLGAGEALRIGRGQCVEHYGAGEAYLPLLEALARMAREPRGEAIVHVLRRYAPTWLAQLPALLSDEDLEAVQRRAQGTTRERMLRELSEALEAASMDAPLVLVLEDLHWSDSATVDLLVMLARRSDPAHVLVLATYRPSDVAVSGHPLKPAKQELQLHGHCEEVALDFLSETAVGHYLAERFPSASLGRDLARFLHRNTSGNPLFLVNVVDHLIARGQLREDDGRWQLSVPVDDIASEVPDTLWQLVDKQIERLTASEQAVLGVASVAGAEFSAALASADGIDVHDAEDCCAALARRGQFMRAHGRAEWPDGTVAGRYAFVHALYRTVLYARVPVGHRVGLHLRIGARLERAHGPRAAEIAGELAMHFEQGRDFERAVQYRKQAADNALRHHGHREAVDHATGALELLRSLPDTPARIREELAIQTVLGASVIATNGWADPKVARAYARARELCTETDVAPQLFPVLLGLNGFYLMRGELEIAQEMSQQLSTLADTTKDAAVLLAAHNTAGLGLFYRGEFAAALARFEQATEFHDPQQHSPNRLPTFSVDHDPGVSCGAHTALTLMMLGYQDRAAARMRECLAYSRSIEHPLSLAMAYNFAATFYQFRREPRVVQELEDVRLEYSTKHDFALFLLLGEIYRGWLAAEQGRGEEGAARIRQGLAVYQAVGAALGRPTFLAILAQLCDELGQHSEALSVIDEAADLAERTGLHYWDAELRRLKGTCILHSEPSSPAPKRRPGRSPAEREAESCFLEAIEIARRQEGKSFELRAAMSLSGLWQRQGKIGQAHALLSEVYGWFTEGFDTPDLVDARGLLEQLGGATRPIR